MDVRSTETSVYEFYVSSSNIIWDPNIVKWTVGYVHSTYISGRTEFFQALRPTTPSLREEGKIVINLGRN